MIFKRYEWRLVLRVVIMFITITVTSLLVVNGSSYYIFLIITVPLVVYEVIDLIRFQ